jgi:septal ring factor EnvC (AmiA/AmiB activator)
MEQEILKALSNLNSRLDSMENNMNDRFNTIENEIGLVKVQVKENTDILKAVRHNLEVNKAEHDKMMNDIAHIKGDVEKLRRDITSVEAITAKNWSDIIELKVVK